MHLPIKLFVVAVLCVALGEVRAVDQKQENASSHLQPNNVAVDEVVVESSLYIKPKPRPLTRRTKRGSAALLPELHALMLAHNRNKRQLQAGGRGRKQRPQQFPQPGDYSQSQAAANAQSNSHSFDQFGNSNAAQANAIGQAFQSSGGAGSFGASSAGSVTQTHQNGPFGQNQNSAAISHSQTYTLPNGQTINFGLSNSFANGPFGNNANSRGSAVSVNQG